MLVELVVTVVVAAALAGTETELMEAAVARVGHAEAKLVTVMAMLGAATAVQDMQLVGCDRPAQVVVAKDLAMPMRVAAATGQAGAETASWRRGAQAAVVTMSAAVAQASPTAAVARTVA